MKSSRGLLQKKEREAKLKNIMSSSSSTRNQDKSTNSVNPKSTNISRVSSSSSSVSSAPRQQQKQQPKKYEDEYVKKNSVPQPQVEEEEYHEEEEHQQDYEEERDEQDNNRKKRTVAIVSKSVLSKIIHDAGVDGVSSDVYSFMIMEMQNYIREVIKVVSEGGEDDELVIRESDLKFLGDKSKAPGSLDVKSFERLYAGVADSLNTNAEFSSGAFKAFCAHTEIQMIKFLRKAKELITCYNKKRLGAKDLECLKKMLDDSE